MVTRDRTEAIRTDRDWSDGKQLNVRSVNMKVLRSCVFGALLLVSAGCAPAATSELTGGVELPASSQTQDSTQDVTPEVGQQVASEVATVRPAVTPDPTVDFAGSFLSVGWKSV